jgi:hypothetical protein
MDNSQILIRTISRAFILSWIFAVLWVKEYFWGIFSVAIVLYVWNEVTFVLASLRRIDFPQPTASTGATAADEDPDVWREPKPPKSSTRARKS